MHPDKIEIPHIEERDILELVGPLYFKRGEDYWRQRKVLSVKYIAPEQKIKAYVAGSGRKRYIQDIRFSCHNGEFFLETECSCPVAFDCKHVAAALLEFLHGGHSAAPETKQEIELNRWMQTLQSSLRTASPEHKTSEMPVLYILQSQIPGRVYVHLLKSRPLKKGGWGRGSPISLGEFRHGFPPYWCGEDDARLCTLIASQISTNPSYLKGTAGAFILRQMLATGRCFWQSLESAPLREGETLILQPHWLEHDGQYRLQLDLPGISNWHLIGTDPPLYLDTARHIAGCIDGGFNSEVLRQLLQIPPVPPSKAAHVGRFLLHQPALAQLPPPVELNERRIDAPLIPDLLLTQVRYGDMMIPLAELGFQYGEYRLTGPGDREDGLALIEDGDTLITLQRDRDAETAALNRLLEQGFAPGHEFDLETTNPLQFVLPAPQPAAMIERWLTFVEQRVPELRAAGWEVRIAPEFDLHVRDAEPEIELSDGDRNGWFEMTLHVNIDGRQLPLAPLLIGYLQQYDLDTTRDSVLLPLQDSWLRLPTHSIQPLISTLLELFNPRDKSGATLQLPNSHATLLNGLDESGLRWRDGEKIRALSRQLKNFDGIRKLPVPAELRATLRPYQCEGLNWLGFLRAHGFGGILADDMGLGKTLQTLAFILHEKQHGRLQQPALIVAPTSLVWNWRQEANTFAPSLRILILHGAERMQHFKRIEGSDLIITTYPLMPRDVDQYKNRRFSIIVLDEAQQVKNPRAKAAQCLRQIKADMRLCLTGTPMENHLGELWSLLDFALPGLLGGEMFFRRHFRAPIEKQADADRQAELRRRIAPFMLRRSKAQVIAELPAKAEIAQWIELEAAQRNLYETIRISMEKKVRSLLREKGLAKSHIEFLDALLKLRQVCCDPRLVSLANLKKTAASGAKLAWLRDNLPEMIEEGRRILLFSQFTSMLDLIEPELKSLNISYCLLTGQTRNRPQVIQRFQSGEVPLFLISLKAGGTGLNLTAADVVIHYDPWWNPAVEQQATDRAHRIGQDKPVFVYKLIARNTVEEKIQQLQQKKRQLADTLFDSKQQNIWQGDAEELLTLLS
jgi:superfamily II DNA or RNA helicase